MSGHNEKTMASDMVQEGTGAIKTTVPAVILDVVLAWLDLERCYAANRDEKELCGGEFEAYKKALLKAGLSEKNINDVLGDALGGTVNGGAKTVGRWRLGLCGYFVHQGFSWGRSWC